MDRANDLDFARLSERYFGRRARPQRTKIEFVAAAGRKHVVWHGVVIQENKRLARPEGGDFGRKLPTFLVNRIVRGQCQGR